MTESKRKDSDRRKERFFKTCSTHCRLSLCIYLVFICLVLSPCQSTQLNIRNLKEHLSKMAATYNETANDLKSVAENATQWTQQPPLTVPQNQSRHQQHAVRRQMLRVRVCRIIARETRRMEKYFIEPKCTADGKFESIQCGPSGKKCWCVDENGRMIGFMKPQEKLNCSNVHQGRRQK